jgi:hypothetical protein
MGSLVALTCAFAAGEGRSCTLSPGPACRASLDVRRTVLAPSATGRADRRVRSTEVEGSAVEDLRGRDTVSTTVDVFELDHDKAPAVTYRGRAEDSPEDAACELGLGACILARCPQNVDIPRELLPDRIDRKAQRRALWQVHCITEDPAICRSDQDIDGAGMAVDRRKRWVWVIDRASRECVIWCVGRVPVRDQCAESGNRRRLGWRS